MSRKMIIAALAVMALGACRRDSEPNKIIDALPVNTTIVVVPAQAAQQFVRLERAILATVIPALNKLAIANPTFPELTPQGGANYGFNLSDGRFGTASVTVQFRDAGDAAIDPIQTQSSSATVKSVVISGNGSSAEFNYTFSQRVTVATAGEATSAKTMTGTASFGGIVAPDSISFELPSQGQEVTDAGLSRGIVTGAGSGPAGAATTLSLQFSISHESDGSIAWENQTGTIHLEADGEGFIVSGTTRILVH